MQIPDFVYVLGAIAFVILLVIIILVIIRSRQVNLTTPDSPDEKPEWLKYTPPKETMAATLADGEGITLFNHDDGEQVAAPFVEQIEDILQAQMKDDPQLASVKVDLGTNETGELDIWVDGTKYGRIEDIPNQRLQAAIVQAVDKWKKDMESQA